MYNGY